MKSGFTVVEVLITLVILTILLGLGTAGLRSSLANGRDAERKMDTETLARALETRYINGNSKQALPVPPALGNWPDPERRGKGFYPGVNEFAHTKGWTNNDFNPSVVPNGYISENFPGASKASLMSPSGIEMDQGCTWSCQPAGNNAQLASSFGNPVQDKYLYEPFDRNGNICSNGDCVGFTLYWISEVDKTVNKGIAGLKMIKSKHQQ
jgi:prepilin-type N-terminal cleavage/methylation domain-containing protein